MTGIKELRETARQEGITAADCDDLAGKHPEEYEYYKALANLARANKEDAELAIKVIMEAEQPNGYWREK